MYSLCLLHFCAVHTNKNWLHSALELRFFCLSLFLFYYFASRTTVDVVARSAAAWMNISAASNFLKQLSDERNTRQINTRVCVCVCLCWVFIYMRCSLCAAVYIQGERGLCTPMCVCVWVCYVLKLRRTFIYVQVHVALVLAIPNVGNRQHSVSNICCVNIVASACIQKSYGNSNR